MEERYLFKAKIADDGEWVEGVPIRTHIGLFMCFDENPHYCHMYGYMEIDKIIKVDEETLCQYTGLKDKHGNKIWENDIVSVTREDGFIEDAIIDYHISSMMSGFRMKPLGDWCCTSFDEVEVIGNKFDNPELVEE